MTARNPSSPASKSPTSPSAEDLAATLEAAQALLASDARRALSQAESAARSARAARLPREAALARRLMAHAKRALDRHEEALADYAAARRSFLALGDRSQAARTLIGRVDALMYLDRLDEATRTGRKALAEFRALGDRQRAGRVLMNLGNLQHRRDRPVRALALYQNARTALEEGSSEIDLALVDYNLGNVLVQLGRFAEAESRFRSVRGAAERAAHPLMIAFATFGLAEVDAVRARYRAALERLESCERDFTALGHERARCNCLLDRAEIYHGLALHAESLHASEEAQHGFEEQGLAMEATRASFFRGLATLGVGKVRDGRRVLAETARKFERLGNPLQAAAVELRRVQAESARRTARDRQRDRVRLERAKRVFRRHGIGSLLAEAEIGSARIALQERDLRSASRRLASADRQFDASDRPDVAARVAHLRACIRERQEGPDAAASQARVCLGHLERLRERLGDGEFVGLHSLKEPALYRDLLRITSRRPGYPPRELFGMLERIERTHEVVRRRPATRGGAELERLRARLAELTTPARRELPERGSVGPEAIRLREVRKLERELQERTRRARLRRTVRPARSKTRSGSARPPNGAFPLPELQTSLGSGEVWIHLVDEGETIGALVVDSSDVRRLPGVLHLHEVRERLDRLRYHTEIVRVAEAGGGRRGAHLLRSAERALANLGTCCLSPLSPVIGDASSILLRPTAALDAIPWGALGHRGAPLWESATVALVPDARDFVEKRLAGNIQDTGSAAQLWSPGDRDLPHARAESGAIRRILGGGRRFDGGAATREAFLREAGSASLIHFTGHGTFRTDDPFFSSLRFSDRELTFLDLEEVSLRAALVVLSACRTGRSRAEIGIGTGFSRGFLRSGAGALLVSLWPVADRATLEFMERFYARLASGDSPAASLRGASLDLRASLPHPADWAAFQLVSTAPLS